MSKGSGAKRNDLKMVFQTWLYWYYYLQRCVINMEQENIFKWKHYQPDIILLTVRWYLRYNLSLRDLVEMMEERGLFLAHTTIMRWVHQYGPELNERIRKHLKSTNDSWRVDETYIKIKGEKCTYIARLIPEEIRLILFKPQTRCNGRQAFSKEDLGFLSCHKTSLDNC